MSQAEEIQSLRNEIRDLQSRIDAKPDGSQAQILQRLVQLESLFESLRSAPWPVVDQVVRHIRKAHGGLKRDCVVVGPWEGREGMFSFG